MAVQMVDDLAGNLAAYLDVPMVELMVAHLAESMVACSVAK